MQGVQISDTIECDICSVMCFVMRFVPLIREHQAQ